MARVRSTLRTGALAGLVLLGVAPAAVSSLAASGCRCDDAARDPERPPWPLDDAIEAATEFLLAQLKDDGSFVYRLNLDADGVAPRYNVLRHAGTIYALSEVHAAQPSPELRAAILKSARFLLERHVDTVRGVGHPGVFSLPDLETRSGRRELKLGGCGLGLVALIRARELDEQLVPLETLRGLGRTILFFQRDNGGFHSKYDEQKKFLEFRSLYYPGEAILALTLLYELDPDPAWLEGAARAAAYLTRSREGATDLPKDHWLMIASARLLPRWGELAAPPIPAEPFRQHVLALGRAFLEQQRAVVAQTGVQLGPTMADERSAPTATTVEGLVAIHGLLRAEVPEEESLRRELELAIKGGVISVMRSQVRDGSARGGILRAPRKVRGDAEFNSRQAEIRIDYVQHALSAFLGARRIGIKTTGA